ncbi:MAG TPA: hypothetical protein VFW00_08270 [Rhodocyclaceae bacterium]|nr:hypothetical protein [Rhodocyclaceae bacterium]
MNEQTPNTVADTSQSASGADRQISRRRLIRSSLAAGPVILTLASKPVLGTTTLCKTPSLALSGALSHADTKTGSCSGSGCGYWKTQSSCPVPKSNAFHTPCPAPNVGHFTKGTQSYCNFGTKTLGDVLNLTYNSNNKVAMHCVAALMNIRAGTVSSKAMDETALKSMWDDYRQHGTFTPFAGATPWNGDQIVSYLVANGIAPV